MTDKLLELTKTISSAYVSKNPVPLGELPNLIADVSAALIKLTAGPEPEKPTPAANPKRTIFPDHIISLETGQKFKSLRRHLSSRGMTPEQYRAKWGLPTDYPMVAANYAAQRSELAKQLGLGRKRVEAVPPAEPTGKRTRKAAVAEAPAVAAPAKKRGRPAKAATGGAAKAARTPGRRRTAE